MVPLSSQRRTNLFDHEPSRVLGDGSPRHISFYDITPERVFVAEPHDRAVIANVVFVHGLTDHAARQFHTALWLAGLGYRTILFDLLGHGGREAAIDDAWWVKEAYLLAQSPRGIANLLQQRQLEDPSVHESVYEQQYSTLQQARHGDHLRQVDRIVSTLLASQWNVGEPPLFFIGHSLGGLICVEAACQWQEMRLRNLQGVILISPALRPQGPPGSLLQNAFIDTVWALRYLPWPFVPFSLVRPTIKSLLDLNFSLDTTWGNPYISNEPDEIHLYVEDPLVLRALPSGYVSSIEDRMVHIDMIAPRFSVDTLLLVPAEDGITSVEGSLHFAHRTRETQGYERFSVVQFAYVRAHDLLSSTVRTETRAAMAKWLGQRATGSMAHVT